MKAWRLALLLVLPLALSRQIRAETDAAAGLPPAVARESKDVKLTPDQAARFDGLRHDFETTAAELHRKIAAHELPHWRLETLDGDFAHAAAGLLTPQQKLVRLTKILQSPTTIEFAETPVRDVLEYLQEVHRGLRIHLDRAALRRAKMSGDSTVSMNLKGLTLDSGLRLLLRQSGLMHVVQDGVVVITTEQEGKRLLARGALDTETLPSPPKDAAHKRLAEVLRTPVTVEFVKTPLKDVVDYLADVLHAQIKLDNAGLSAVGLDDAQSISCNAKFGSLEAGLRQILTPLKLKCVIRDEVILIIADPAAKRPPRSAPPEKPDDPQFIPCPAERDAVDQLDRLGADAGLNDAGQVESISMSEATDGDAVLAVAARLSHLHSLALSLIDPEQCRITDRGLALLPSLPEVPQLTLIGDEITDHSMASLAKLPQLRKLTLRCHKVSDRGIAKLAKLTQLRVLHLDETAVTDAGLAYLTKLSSLETLRLQGTRIDGTGLPALSQLGKLKSLSLRDTLVDDGRLKEVVKLKQLHSLDLAQTSVNGQGLAQLAAIAGLRHLNLSDSAVTDAELAGIGSLRMLKSLELANLTVTDAGLAQLEETHLSSLVLRGTKIDDAGLARLAKIKTLVSLNLSNTRVSDAGLSHRRTAKSVLQTKGGLGT